MKTFRYPLGYIAGETMTAKELRDFLAKYPDDMPVLAMWEGCHACIHPDNVNVELIEWLMAADTGDCLVVDVGYLM